ncbi:anthranilate phosphoribosyltransferase, partial [Effusibacillus lacus]
PYDGRSKSFAATIPVAAILAAAGVPVVLHGSASLPPKYGVTLGDVLQELGMQTVRNKQETANLLDREHLVFVNTEHYCEPLQRLRPVREQLGVRTMLNTAEKFLNVAEADCLVAGVFHTTVIEKAAELTLRLGYRKGMVVQGIDGSEDIPANRPSAVYLIENGSMEKYLINPKEYGLYADDGQAGLTAKQQAQYVQSVLQGEPQFREMVLLNSGLRLWLTSRTESIEQGIELARSILDSGKAWEKFVSVKE